jgi:hypothetical protein
MMNAIDGFVDAMGREVLTTIQERVKKELYPKVEDIVNEEVARYAINLDRFFTVERFGTDVRIILLKKGETK